MIDEDSHKHNNLFHIMPTGGMFKVPKTAGRFGTIRAFLQFTL